MADEITTYMGFKIVFLQPNTLAAYRNEEYMKQGTASYSVTADENNYSKQLDQLFDMIDDMDDEGEFEQRERGSGFLEMDPVGTALVVLSGLFG